MIFSFPVFISNIKGVAKADFGHRAKITALHSQLAFEGKGVGVKSVVTLRGADTSPQHKANKKVNTTTMYTLSMEK